MERCPNCRARQDGDAICRRCGMELARLIEVEQAAEHLTALSVARLAVGDSVAAIDDLARALRLRHERFAALLLGFSVELQSERPTPPTSAIASASQTSAVVPTVPPT